MKRRIEFDPDLFVAQERVEFSTAPAWEKNSLAAQPVSLRVFLVADGEGGYRVMPGGLARISPDSEGNSFPCNAAAAARTPGFRPPHAGRGIDVAARLRARTSSCGARETICRRAWRIIFSGSAATRNARTPPSRLLRSALLRFNPERMGGAKPLLAPLLQTLEIAGPVAGNFREAGVVGERRGVRGGTARGDF